MKKIKVISKGVEHVILVDDEDFGKVSQYTWSISHRSNTKYVRTFPKGKHLKMERLVVFTPKGMFIDHINHNGLDNRKENLRLCTHQQNMHNIRSRRGSTSKYKGVSWHGRDKYWVVQIVAAGKHYYIGYFQDEIKAAEAYDKTAKKLHGEFAVLNFKQKGG